jgi:hypothetical protein
LRDLIEPFGISWTQSFFCATLHQQQGIGPGIRSRRDDGQPNEVSGLRILNKLLARSVLLCGVLLIPAVLVPEVNVPKSQYAEDPRATALRAFLESKDSPITHLTEDFLIAADRYELDWWLLPSIAFLESTAGKAYRNNNIFGWNNANTRFESIREGIYYVGSRLGEGEIYGGKTTAQKLALYNPFDHYAPAVFRVADHLTRLEQEARTRSTTEFVEVE